MDREFRMFYPPKKNPWKGLIWWENARRRRNFGKGKRKRGWEKISALKNAAGKPWKGENMEFWENDPKTSLSLNFWAGISPPPEL